jgi:transposase-like protein
METTDRITKSRAEVVQEALEKVIGRPLEPRIPAVIEFKDLDGPVPCDEMEKRWKRYIEQAKPHVVSITKARMTIAELAANACTIHYGGGDHWKNFSGVYTLKRFAAEIGINSKTLSNWVATYRNVLKKLPEGVYDPNNFEAARRTANKVTRRSTPEEVAATYQHELSSSRDREYLVRGIKRLKTLHYYITVKAYLPELEKECAGELDELYNLAAELVAKIGGSR